MTEETRIKFMTDGVLLKEIQKVRCSSRLVSSPDARPASVGRAARALVMPPTGTAALCHLGQVPFPL